MSHDTESAAERLMRNLDYRLAHDAEPLSRAQVAVVLHALADHTAIMGALAHDPDPSSPWPQATSMGRWFHDTAAALEDYVPPAPPKPTLAAAIEATLRRPFDSWMGNAGHGTDLLRDWIRETLADYPESSEQRDAIDAAAALRVDPYMGNAGHGHQEMSSRVRKAIADHPARS